ncbi:1927_t:CDS:2 [Dentiscutata erythropus]|uniref:1927_t:CDS:1 n=1 Tax=Dentiscutata erythropus TaxID=1348616 RepID=A0A9N9F474_9GLOM|nr:1927_t:CDS:2 [Dentiscutata erythropus]
MAEENTHLKEAGILCLEVAEENNFWTCKLITIFFIQISEKFICGEHKLSADFVSQSEKDIGSYCPLYRENHMSLQGIPFEKVLEAYPENSKLIQELKTQSFTLPISWNNALKFLNKSITMEA